MPLPPLLQRLPCTQVSTLPHPSTVQNPYARVHQHRSTHPIALVNSATAIPRIYYLLYAWPLSRRKHQDTSLPGMTFLLVTLYICLLWELWVADFFYTLFVALDPSSLKKNTFSFNILVLFFHILAKLTKPFSSLRICLNHFFSSFYTLYLDSLTS